MHIDNLWELILPRLQSQRQAGLPLNEIADFCGVTSDTVSSWVHNKRPANGERLIKLWHFLAAKGSTSPELQKMPPLNQRLSELFAFGQISLDEVKQLANVKNSQAALRIMRGQPPMRPSLTVDDLNELYGEQSTKSSSVARAPQTTYSPTNASLPETQEPDLHVSHSGSSLLQSDAKLTLATLLGAALPLLRHFNSNDCTPEERSHLRRLMGDGGMFEASNHLNALCSERARNQGRQGR